MRTRYVVGSDENSSDSEQHVARRLEYPRHVGRPVTNLTKAKVQVRLNYQKRKHHIQIPVGRPRTSTNPKFVRSSQNRRDKKLVSGTIEAYKAGDVQKACELQLASLSTNAGKRAFGPLATAFRTSDAASQVGLNVCRVLATVGASHKGPLVRLCTVGADGQGNVDLEVFANMCGMKESYMRSAHWNDRVLEVKGVNKGRPVVARLLTEKYKPGSTRVPLERPLDKLINDFFKYHSCIRSGAIRSTRELALTNTELMIRFHAEYPRRLRELVAEVPALMETIQKTLLSNSRITRLQSSILYSMGLSLVTGFDVKECEEARAKEAESKYELRLEIKRLNFMKIACIESTNPTAEVELKRLDEFEKKLALSPLVYQSQKALAGHIGQNALSNDTAHDGYQCHPPDARLFWRAIKRLKIHWTGCFKPSECPIHDNGPVHELELADVIKKRQTVGAQLSAIRKVLLRGEHSELELSTQNDLADLEKKHRELMSKVALFKVHLKQYEACRPIIQQITENLVPGDAVVYRDFVAAYNCDGK